MDTLTLDPGREKYSLKYRIVRERRSAWRLKREKKPSDWRRVNAGKLPIACGSLKTFRSWSANSRETVTRQDSELEKIFNGLAEKWRKETGGSSLTMHRYAHPSYQAILVLGGKEPHVIKLILQELRVRPDMWFEALRRLTDEDPAKEEKTFDATVKAWLDWGIKKQIIP